MGHKGKITSNKTTTTGIIDLCYVVKPIVNKYEVVKGILIACYSMQKTKKEIKRPRKSQIKPARTKLSQLEHQG